MMRLYFLYPLFQLVTCVALVALYARGIIELRDALCVSLGMVGSSVAVCATLFQEEE
jgi:hypothetical protein